MLGLVELPCHSKNPGFPKYGKEETIISGLKISGFLQIILLVMLWLFCIA